MTQSLWSGELRIERRSGWVHDDLGHLAAVSRGNTFEESAAIAAEIVRRVNAFPKLVEALKLAHRIADEWAHDQLDGTRSLAGALAELEPAAKVLRELGAEAQTGSAEP